MEKPTSDEVKELGKLIDRMTPAQLEYIFKLGNRRFTRIREEQALENLDGLEEGDRVTLQNIKPKYLSGMFAVVTDIRPDGKVAVSIDARHNTRRYSHNQLLYSAAQLRKVPG